MGYADSAGFGPKLKHIQFPTLYVEPRTMINTNESLYTFRDMANQMFKLAIACRDGDSKAAVKCYDEGLTTMLHVLETKDMEQKMNTVMSSDIGNTITNAYLARDIFEPTPTAGSTKTKSPPTLIIHNDVSPQIVVTKEESAEKVIQVPSNNFVIRTETSGSDADNEEDIEADEADEEAEEAEEADEEAEEADEEAEEADEADEEEKEAEEEEPEVEEEQEEEKAEEEAEAEEEDESMEVIKIGKKLYFLGEHSQKVFIYLNDEEAGEYLGKYVNGKIVAPM
jgi:chemotaxis protein histidine kinase CheA